MLGRKKAINQYGNVAVGSEAGYASPHRLVQMLMEGVLTKLSTAKGQLFRKDYAAKSKEISAAISIIAALKGSLDMEAGGEIAINLDDLYAYIRGRLFDANVDNDIAAIDEVISLVGQIKEAWDAMPAQASTSPVKS